MGAVEIPAPVGGWNARDALSAMNPIDAVELINWVPGNGVVTGRGGSLTKIEDVTGAGDSVETLIPYEGDASTAFLAAAGGEVWDITDLTTPVSLGSAFNSDAWQWCAFNNNLMLVNGEDLPQLYNGTTLAAASLSGPPITDIVGVISFKGRAFYWLKSSASFWYAAAGGFQGALTEFPLANFTQSGGVISLMLSWTRDSGDGVDDLLAIVFNTGETIIYQGDNPDVATQWSMIGRWMIGKPINIRAHARYNSTEIIGTQIGAMGLDEAIQNVAPPDAFGGLVVRAMNAATSQYGDNTGWQFIFYTPANLFLINVPVSDTQSVQYVRNTNTGRWTQFQGWNARCFGLYNKRLYFGTPDGAIVLADTSVTDDLQNAYSDDGTPILYSATTAYQKFGEPGLKTQLSACRVVTTVFDPSSLSLNAFADYRTKPLPPIQLPNEIVEGVWDVAAWDDVYWGGPNSLDPTTLLANPSFRPVQTYGFAIALSVRYQSRVQNVNWYSTEFVFKQGGIV